MLHQPGLLAASEPDLILPAIRIHDFLNLQHELRCALDLINDAGDRIKEKEQLLVVLSKFHSLP